MCSATMIHHIILFRYFVNIYRRKCKPAILMRVFVLQTCEDFVSLNYVISVQLRQCYFSVLTFAPIEYCHVLEKKCSLIEFDQFQC